MKRNELKLIVILLVLSGGLRFAGITFDSLWLDEGYQTLADATGQELPNFVQPANHPFLFHFDRPHCLQAVLNNFRHVDPLCPPLYPLVLNRWMAVFGDSDLTIRLLSMVFSLSSLVVLFVLVKNLFGFQTAIFVSIVQAVSPFDILYAQEARMYSLTVLASAVSCGAFIWLIKQRSSTGRSLCGLLVYVGSTWALINSHYTALFILVFQGLFGTWYCLRQRLLRLYTCLVCSWVCIFLLWLPWFDLFRQAAALRTASFYVVRSQSWWWPLWALAVRIPFNWVVFLTGKKVMLYAVPLYVTAALMLVLAAVFALPDKILNQFTRWCSLQPSKVNKPLLADGCDKITKQDLSFFMWSWAIVPAVAVWLLDVVEGHKVIEISRYLIATAPAIYVLVGLGLSRLYTNAQTTVCPNGAENMQRQGALHSNPFVVSFVPWFLMSHVTFALINNAYAHLIPQREPWREMASKIESLCHRDDLIVVSQYYDIVCLDRYLKIPMRQLGVSPSMGATDIDRLLANHRRFWLVTAQEGDKVKALIPARFKALRHLDLGHSLHLLLYEAL